MNKKTGEFSAADLKRPVGRKEQPIKGHTHPSYKAATDQFLCNECGHATATTELAKDNGNGGKLCKACVARFEEIANGKFRASNGQTYQSYKKSIRKRCEKNYKSGKLPKFMFS